MDLRNYQEEAIQAVFAAQKEGMNRLLVVLPTGAGKTVVFSTLAKLKNTKTLILAHRDELLQQAIEKLKMVWPEADAGIVKAKQNEYDKQIVVASVQTLCRPRRLEEAKNQDFQLCIIDEAHHAVSPTYRTIIEGLGFMDQPEKLLVGVTATPMRADNIGLHNVFQKAVSECSILRLIRAGYLSDIKAIRVTTETDLSGVKTRAGDFAINQLSEAINVADRNALIVESYLKNAMDRKAIAFCVDIKHAEDLAEEFRKQGITAKAVSGKDSDEDRKAVLEEFSRGEIQVLCNCALLTEGYDEPSVSCVLMARPTKSMGLYMQCIGRGTRLFPGKKDCVVLDFFDSRHDICSLPGIFGKDLEIEDGESVTEAVERKERKENQARQIAMITQKKKEEEFDLLGKSKFQWLTVRDEWMLPVVPGKHILLKPAKGGKYSVQLIADGAFAEWLHPAPLDFGYSMGLSEDYARKNGKFFARKDAKWRREPATDKQIGLLRLLGADIEEGLTKGMAYDMIAVLKGRAG